jgi:regulator of nucleoside diphosphate kinase
LRGVLSPARRPFAFLQDKELDMADYNDLIVSARDAELLAPLVDDRRRFRPNRPEADAADALADVLMDARMVAHERLPADRVAMNFEVTYREDPDGESRTVILVHPSEAAPSRGRVSVLSPVGRALLGRRAGAAASINVPGRTLNVRVLAVGSAHASERAS